MLGRLVDIFKQRISEQTHVDGSNVLSGSMKDFSEYRYACGYLKGLSDAGSLLEQCIADLEKGN